MRELLRYMKIFTNARKAEGVQNKKPWFLEPKDPATAYELARVLHRHKITTHQLSKDTKIAGKTILASSYVVPLNQPKNKLIQPVHHQQKFEDSLRRHPAWSFQHANQNLFSTPPIWQAQNWRTEFSKKWVKAQYACLSPQLPHLAQ